VTVAVPCKKERHRLRHRYYLNIIMMLLLDWLCRSVCVLCWSLVGTFHSKLVYAFTVTEYYIIRNIHLLIVHING